MVGPEGEWGCVWRLIFRRPVTHKKYGMVQDIAAALKKSGSKDVQIGAAKNIHHYDRKEDSTVKS